MASTALPREIIKWIQSLDLSYSFKDQKRDLNNGFLIAEIFSRYYPRDIQMHSFDNSQNVSRRINNWTLLEIFCKKKEIPIEKSDFEKILENDFQALVNLMSKIYSFLTQKKLNKPPLLNLVQTRDFMSTNQTNQELGASFILKDKGLEKIEEKKEKREEREIIQNDSNQSENKSILSAQATAKKTNYLRNYNKPISQNSEAVNLQIDVRNLNVRNVPVNVSKLKEKREPTLINTTLSHKEKTPGADIKNSNIMSDMTSNNGMIGTMESQKALNKKEKTQDRNVFDALNEIIFPKFSSANNAEELKKIKAKNTPLIQSFMDNIETFSDEFTTSFFQEIIAQMEGFIKFVFKDPNESWRMMNFLFTCLKGLGPDKEAFRVLVELTKLFGQKCLEYNPMAATRTTNMFTEYFLPILATQIKSSLVFERKEMLLQLLFAFCPNDSNYKHSMIASYKELLKNTHCFLQSLVVIARSEKSLTDENKILFDDILHYAHSNAFSSSTNLRTMALALYSHIADLNYELVLDRILGKVDALAKNDWWETKCLCIIIFSKMIKGIVNSEKYMNLVKMASHVHKTFNAENEALANKLKEKVERLANAIKVTSYPPSSEMILRTTFIYVINLIGEHKILMELFVHLILLCNEDTRKWVLYSEIDEIDHEEYYVQNDKSIKHRTNIKSSELQKFAANILLFVVEELKEVKVDQLSPEYMDLVIYGFSYTDFKLLNIESCENIANTLKEYVFLALCEEESCEGARMVLEKLLKLQFFSEVKIKDSDGLFSSAICLIFENNFEGCKSNVEELLQKLISDGFENSVEVSKRFLTEVYIKVRQRLGDETLHKTNLSEIFYQVDKMVKREEDDRVRRQTAQKESE